MIPIVGSVALNLALGLIVLSFIALGYSLARGDRRLYLVGQRMVEAGSWLVVISTLVLVNELLRGNFDIDYVAHYTSLNTPILYKFAALWAGQSGSLLFWLFIQAVYTLIVIYLYQKQHAKMMPWVLIILATIQLFFLVMINFITNPFLPVTVDFIISDGNGLNPLLQNLTMAIHPPTLYLGYVGFSVPFAFALAGMIVKDDNQIWIRSVRRWTLITWLFLTIGIILGGWWAYQELGWGGYWAWDPVENASFMPWLTGTAFVHSIIIQEKKNMLKIWNMVLIIITFALAIFGTFLTRSGIMSSVHSFAASSLGPLFLGFVFLILFVSFGLLYSRASFFRSTQKIESFSSRESGFLFNNVIFVVICFTVFWGTLFPVLTEAVRGTKITVGPPFFNQVNIPIGMVLLLLTGVGPLLAWRRTSKRAFIRNFQVPLSIGLIAAIILAVLGFTGYVLISFTLVAFVIAAILVEFYRGISARQRRFGESVVKATGQLFEKNKSRYSGYIVHLGIALMFVGFTGAAFNKEKEFGIKLNGIETVGAYTFTLENLSEEERSNHYAFIADLRINDSEGKYVTNLKPEKRIYFHRHPNPERRQPHSELAIQEGVMRDIYTVYNGMDDNDAAYFKIMVNPLVWWVWFGSYIVVAGTILAWWPRRKKA